MKNVLIVYYSHDGHTKSICEYLKKEFKKVEITLINIVFEKLPDLDNFEKIFFVSPIRYGYYKKEIVDFVYKNSEFLNKKDSYFIAINLVARKENKNTPETNIYTRKFLHKTPWSPKGVLVIGGKLDYSLYGFLDGFLIKLIMKITKGPTKTAKAIDYTDYNKLNTFFEENIK